jgi:hypothetical protein
MITQLSGNLDSLTRDLRPTPWSLFQDIMHDAQQSFHLRLPVRLPGKRAALTNQQVIEIFGLRQSKCEISGSSSHFTLTSRSKEISRKFGVSPKAVRDIWNRRTWCSVTSVIFPDANTNLSETITFPADSCMKASVREATGLRFELHGSKGGRPRGSKDSKPRKRRYLPYPIAEMSQGQCHSLGLATQLAAAAQYALPDSLDPSKCESKQTFSAVAIGNAQFDRIENTAEICSFGDLNRSAVHGDEECSLYRTYPFFLQF